MAWLQGGGAGQACHLALPGQTWCGWTGEGRGRAGSGGPPVNGAGTCNRTTTPHRAWGPGDPATCSEWRVQSEAAGLRSAAAGGGAHPKLTRKRCGKACRRACGAGAHLTRSPICAAGTARRSAAVKAWKAGQGAPLGQLAGGKPAALSRARLPSSAPQMMMRGWGTAVGGTGRRPEWRSQHLAAGGKGPTLGKGWRFTIGRQPAVLFLSCIHITARRTGAGQTPRAQGACERAPAKGVPLTTASSPPRHKFAKACTARRRGRAPGRNTPALTRCSENCCCGCAASWS